MTASTERQQRVAASFTRQYYTHMLESPGELPAFYTPTASFLHMGRKAQGTAEIEAAIAALYSVQPNASAKIDSLSTVTKSNGNFLVTIKGSITASPGAIHDFTHEVELTEHEPHSGSFGIVSDNRESAPREEAPRRWALETPPMFASEPAKDTMEPIEQPAAMTAVAPVERPAKGNAGNSASEKAAPAPAAAAVADVAAAKPATAPSSRAVPPATAETEKETEQSTKAPPTAEPAPTAEVKKPKSFAEAILMGKRGGASQAHAAPIVVVAKEGKEQQPAEVPAKENEKKETNKEDTTEKDVTKSAPRNGITTKRPTGVHASGEGEKRNGKPTADRSAAGNNHKEGGSNNRNNNSNNGENTKRRDADGRTLSRSVVFYDVIVKGLPTDATEQMVRDIVEPTAPVKLVKLLSQNDKKDSNVVRTFAFVQLDHNAIKDAGDDVKATVAKVLAANKGKKSPGGHRIQVDEVREKYTAAPTNAPVEVSA
ncbi:mucin-associated surface protein (MASP) [Trypanosoma grayi]|uniref:mucin-associated surface protein (MASP) n=1 Tax=Trypanosoma grayi TaxID=71804 RepID=UPI0004F42629|nr:mucin-associated surface protein (MASP) [Trypanosoma grayi]KEG15079.1 mucin-associated surface protein (MASP) [Trypanosoma grayi]